MFVWVMCSFYLLMEWFVKRKGEKKKKTSIFFFEFCICMPEMVFANSYCYKLLINLNIFWKNYSLPHKVDNVFQFEQQSFNFCNPPPKSSFFFFFQFDQLYPKLPILPLIFYFFIKKIGMATTTPLAIWPFLHPQFFFFNL
jgi:hypothetical protein